MTENSNSDTRYMAEHYLQERWDRVGRKLAMTAESRSEFDVWQRVTRAKLMELTGYDTMITAPLDPVVTDEEDMGNYTRQRVEIQTEPGVIMSLYVLVPEGDGPFPAVLCPHGHGSGGKYSVVGRRDIPELAERIDKHNYDYGVQFCRAGFIAFCPDARGFGERQERLTKKGNIVDSSCQYLNNMAYPLGQTVTGMWAWDLHRLIDYVETREDAIQGALGCAGLSGGGLQTLWASAFDERITCAVISGYFYGYRESLLTLHGNCACNYVPRLYEHVDIGDVGALIAPRPVLFETGDEDGLNGPSGLDNVTPQVDTVRRAYRLYDAEDRVCHDVFHGGHKWNGVEAIPWMQRHVAGATSAA